MKATCRSWFVCPMGVAVYLYLTPDMVERGPLKDWACPEYSKCKECSYAHTPSDKRRKRTCDFDYAFTERLVDIWVSGEEFSRVLDSCSGHIRGMLKDWLSGRPDTEEEWNEWLKERRPR